MIDEPILSVKNLRTTYYTDQETIRAVDGVSFTLRKRGSLGIVGESGSGKSVTARSILGLVDAPGKVHPDSEIRYHEPGFVEKMADRYPKAIRWSDRQDSTDEGFIGIESGQETDDGVKVESGWVDLVGAPESVVKAARGSEIAMVFQDAQTSLNPLYTVGNQIKELLKIHRGQRGREATETAADLLESVGIPDPKRRLKEFPHQFSGGMQQRATIALALACDPSVLICDEPTTALDVTIQAQILELLDELQEERDLSIIFITHDMGVIAHVARTITVMYAGEIVEVAPVYELFEAPKHPYTRGLLESIPGRSLDEARLPTIEGSVPTPNTAPTSCRYAPRCPKAFEECEAVHPALVDVGTETVADTGEDSGPHTAACLLYPEELGIDDRLLVHEDVHHETANPADPTMTGGSSDE